MCTYPSIQYIYINIYIYIYIYIYCIARMTLVLLVSLLCFNVDSRTATMIGLPGRSVFVNCLLVQ